MGAAPEALLVCCAGGGLTAGCALAWEALLLSARVFAVEPAGFDDTARSLAAGKRLGNAPDARSICDAVLAPMPGSLTFSINASRLGGGLVVTDAKALVAVRTAFEEFGVVMEPGGAVALAAALFGRLPVANRTIAVALTGANVDPAIYAEAISSRAET